MMAPSLSPRMVARLLSFALCCASSLAPAVASAQPVAGPIALLRDSRSARARLLAMQTIAQLRPNGGREALEEQLTSPSPRVRLAAVQALGRMRDPASQPSLARLSGDRDRRVRDAARQVLSTLAAQGNSGVAAPVVAHAQVAADWSQVRCVLAMGALNDHTQHDPARAAQFQDTVRRTLGTYPDVALHPGVLPPDAQRRVRAGALRQYGLDGALTGLSTLDAPGTVGMRAEVQLLLMSGHALAGSLGGAATARESAPILATATDPHPRLTGIAMEGAVRAALNQMETYCAPAPRRGRRR
jgi:hypothetical protein